jgi:hypothetical protein
MAVTDENGADLLRKQPGAVQGEQGTVTDEQGSDPGILRDCLGGRGRGGDLEPPASRAPGPALDSEAVTDPADAPERGERTPATVPLGFQGADPFPVTVGNRPQALVPRYPQPVAIDGEDAITADALPAKITTAWIRGQVDATVWQKHWTHGGRITPAMINECYLGLCKGYSQAGIRRRLGIDDNTWYEWMKRADTGSEIHRVLKRVVEAGLGSVESEVVEAWVSKVPDDWRAAQEFLKTRFPQDWNPNVQVEVTHAGTVQHEGRLVLDDNDLLKVASILQQHGVLDTGGGDVIDAEVVGEG